KLFWLFVGAVGFVAGLSLAARFLGGQPDWVVLVLALAAGLVGIVLAIALQKIAVGVAGFVAGGYILVWLADVLGLAGERWFLLAFVIGGIIGLILVAAVFEVALVALSALAGASLVVQAVDLRPALAAALFLVLLLIGLAVQASGLPGKPSQSPKSR
ncbi:MAG: hypothetical protein ACE5H9_19325, partial [Anaerolineae bacterium]